MRVVKTGREAGNETERLKRSQGSEEEEETQEGEAWEERQEGKLEEAVLRELDRRTRDSSAVTLVRRGRAGKPKRQVSRFNRF